VNLGGARWYLRPTLKTECQKSLRFATRLKVGKGSVKRRDEGRWDVHVAERGDLEIPRMWEKETNFVLHTD
jgi:hypothetical protein